MLKQRLGANPKKISSFTELVENYDTFIFDCDGVLWHAGEKLDKAFETLNVLRERGKNVFFLTNNSTKSRKKYTQRFATLGFETPSDHIFSSSYIGPAYIKLQHPEIKKMYIVGMEGLMEETKEAGFTIVGGSEDNNKRVASEMDFVQMPFEKDIDAVMIGYDMDFNYYKLAYASACLQKGAKFFATNADPYDMVGDMKIPTNGAMISALENATGKSPLVLGKPNKYSIDLIIDLHKVDRKRCLMIGDRIDTDILCGKNSDVDTCLVLTGVYNQEMLDQELKSPSPIVPTFVCPEVCWE